MSILTKLNILNLDMTVFDNGLTKEEFMSIYDPKDNINNWKSSFSKDMYNDKDPRTLLARYEHKRWNAHKVLNAWIPMRKSDISSNDTKWIIKSEERKQHLCITTFEGLMEIDKYLEQLNETHGLNHNTDFIKYDFDAMDNIYEILSKIKLGITKIK